MRQYTGSHNYSRLSRYAYLYSIGVFLGIIIRKQIDTHIYAHQRRTMHITGWRNVQELVATTNQLVPHRHQYAMAIPINAIALQVFRLIHST